MHAGIRFVGIGAMVIALAACSGDISTVDQAEAQVKVKEKAVADAEAALIAGSEAFCASSETYIEALDRYGDILNDTTVTVGDVATGGADLVAPREEAFEGAATALAAQEALYEAEQELADAQATLEEIKAGPSGTPTVEPVEVPEPEPLAPEATVERVKQADEEFEEAMEDITPDTPLTEASEQFNAAAVALEMSWLRLFVDAGCASEDEVKAAEEAVSTYTTSLQKDLKDAGYYEGEVDGIYGPKTVDAVEALQEESGLPVTGTVDKATAEALQAKLVELGVEDADEELVTTAALQQSLKFLRFYEGPVDGVWSDELTDAVKDFQEALGVEETGEIDADTIAAWDELVEKLHEALSPSPEPSASASATPSPTQLD